MSANTNGHSNGASDASKTVPLWIDGKEIVNEDTFDVTSPTTSQKLWSSSSVSSKQAVQAIEAAQKALKTWRKTKPSQIRTIFLKAADVMEARREELVGYMKEETGALDGFTAFNIDTTVENFRDVAGRAANISGVIPQTGAPGQSALVYKEPYGVNLAIAPWNAPYILGVRSFLYPIAAGNTVVLKGSELCPRLYWALGSIMKEAGLPDGVLNVIFHRPGDGPEITNTLVDHPQVRKINFTGSTMVGSIIASRAGKECKPVLMELGGKASAIICEDANIEHAAFQAALGSFLHAGQICMSTERIIVNRKILEPFSKALKEASEKLYSSEGEAPVLIAKAGVEKNVKLVSDAVSKGAKLIRGDVDTHSQSAYRVQPVIVSDVKKDMDIYYTESFGPTVSLIAVDSDEEAIEVANDTEYGLSGAIFTESLARGLKIAKEVESGAVHINSMSVHDEAMLPHGGTKKSGWGRFNAQWGIEEFLRLKTVTYMD